jgi:hypothetical protein
MACSFGLLPHPRSEAVRPAHRPATCDRECPLVTAGDRCLWHAGGTRPVGTMWFAPVGEGSPLAGRVRLSAGDDGLVGKLRSGAASQWPAGITVGRAACSAALGGAHATTTPGSDNRERRGDQPSRRSLIFRVQQALIQHFVPYARDAPHQYVQPTFISFYPRIINPLGLRDKWD